MTPEVSDFIPGSLEDTDKYIEVVDVNHVTAKQKGQVRIQMCDNNRKTFMATLYNVLLGQVIFNHYVNECRTYLSFSQSFLHGVLRNREEKCSNITTYCTK